MVNEQVALYWVEVAEEDFASMERIYSAGEYIWALHVGIVAVEDLLKACYSRRHGGAIPETHNLLMLAREAGLEAEEDRTERLNHFMVLRANLEKPDWRRKFRPAMGLWRAEREMKALRELREWLLGILST